MLNNEEVHIKTAIPFKALQILWFTRLIPTDAQEKPTSNVCRAL